MNSSPGDDGFHPRILKTCARELCSPLSKLFTHIFQSTVPDAWKSGLIIPIHKDGSRSDPSNYRPVTLLSVVSKLMESIIADEITTHFESNGLLHAQQHGFRRQRSCLTNLLCARDQWTKAADEGFPTHVAYLDFSKAFDRVDHSILLAKLHSYGVRGNLLFWLSSYLCNRSFHVSVHGTLSTKELVTSGVPQGSILGPLLFNIFINDLLISASAPCVFYADDSKIWTVIRSPVDEIRLQEELNRIYDWTKSNKLPLNFEKSKVLSNSTRTRYSLGNVLLQNVQCERDLGVITEASMSVSKQCLAAKKKAMKTLGLLKRILGKFEPAIYPFLFSCYIRPHLEFSVQAWNPWLLRDQRSAGQRK